MAIEIQGTVVAVGNVRSGVSEKTGQPWARQQIVVARSDNDNEYFKTVLEVKNEDIQRYDFHRGNKGSFRYFTTVEERQTKDGWWGTNHFKDFVSTDPAKVNPGEQTDLPI